MYQVIELFGDYEPWWFLEGWEEDIVSFELFESYGEALSFYQMKGEQFAQLFPKKEEKRDQPDQDVMVAFWNPDEQRWCEECGENLQQFHSLLIRTVSESVTPLSKTVSEPSSKVKICRLQKEA
ncbi:DUF1033 family protein [Streptococcus moroccensis]|uniref:DUF1033 family protein n=1 Tax=Streptococcus moroccensis TaxID=1451356 RepID=A0ABT9YSG0_9STRE|nr:DUF1033 family protein [Streptococcus moroccensis]MDQ0222928.1 hypothetical protein [Streptococcus moroccensis]